MDNENKNNQEDGQEKSQEKGKRSDYYAKQPRFGGKGPSKIRQQFNRGMTAFLVVAASILFYFALLRLTNLSEGFTKIFDVLKPVIYGCVFAYLMNPIVKQVDNYLRPVLEKKIKKHDGARKLSRACGIFLSIIILFVLIITLCNLLIPELYSSIRNLVFTLPGQLNELVDKLNNVKLEDSTTGALIKTAVEEGTDMLQTWLRTDLLTRANDIMSNLTVGVISIISEIINALIGIIISIYILFSKETFSRQSKKTVYALMKPEHGNMLLHLATKSNEIFGGFIIGKIIDSLIIGVLCFMGLSILNMPYTVLVSVIIGVTNVGTERV